MSVASFIASQRTDHGVPHAMCCRWLGVSRVVVLQVARPRRRRPASSAAPSSTRR